MSRRWIVALLLSGAAASCGVQSRVDVATVPSNPATRTFDAHGISFQYPGDWVAFDAETPDPALGASQKSKDVIGLDDLNVVSVTELLLGPSERGVSAWNKRIGSEFAAGFLQSGIVVKSGPDKIRLGGEKGLRWEISQPSGIGYVLDTTLVVMFRGDTEYFVRCQHTTEKAPEIDRGCDQILTSFKLANSQA